MDTHGKTDVEFYNKVKEILAHHESKFHQVNTTLQVVLTELQALKTSLSPTTSPPEINLPFCPLPTTVITKVLPNSTARLLGTPPSKHVMVANKEKVGCARVCQALQTDNSKLTMSLKKNGVAHTIGELGTQGMAALTKRDFSGMQGLKLHSTVLLLQLLSIKGDEQIEPVEDITWKMPCGRTHAPVEDTTWEIAWHMTRIYPCFIQPCGQGCLRRGE